MSITDKINDLLTKILGSKEITLYNKNLPRKTAQPATITPTNSPKPSPEAVQQALSIARNPNFSKYSVNDDVKNAIEQASKQYNVPADLLYDIALQESSFDPTKTAKEGGFADSTAGGLFMFNDPTWDTVRNYDKNPKNTINLPNDNRMDPTTSALAAAYLIKMGQLGRWDASKGVWGQHYKPEELQSYYSQTKK